MPQLAQIVRPMRMIQSDEAKVSSTPQTHTPIIGTMKRRRPKRFTAQPESGTRAEPAR